MTPATKAEPAKEGMIDRIVAIVTLRGPMRRFDGWLGRKHNIDFYRLEGDKVIAPRGRRFNVQDIRTWQEVFIGMGVPLIVTEFSDGRRADWSDKYAHLFTILRRVAPEKELPFTAE
jgi:hypothetical protein